MICLDPISANHSDDNMQPLSTVDSNGVIILDLNMMGLGVSCLAERVSGHGCGVAAAA